MTTNTIFFNQVFDKKRLKVLIAWVFKEFGEKQALRVVEELKTIGFYNATQAGLSIGLNDLTTPSQKSSLLSEAELDMNLCDQYFNGGRITATERNQRIVDTWHRVSETLRKQVVEHFSTYDQLNPVYIMALSGARGNFSQVRQLVGMRGLMADPQGQIISFPIRSNLREGLTLTEYFISCSGARKGLVDTALRTADTGYLTRRLVDVSHHIVIKKICCNTEKGITVRALKSENKLLLSLSDRLIGRVLAQNIEYPEMNFPDKQSSADFVSSPNSYKNGEKTKKSLKNAFILQNKELQQKTTDLQNNFLAQKNQEIDPTLASKIQTVRDQVIIRSPLTCALTHSVCQLCYGWSLSQGRLVSLGEAVGVIAAQSIGEPGTQLTMRTFHTGGVFSGDLLQEIRAPHSGKIEFSKAFQGLMIRTTDGRIAFLTKTSGEIILKNNFSESENVKSLSRLNLSFVNSSEKFEDTFFPFFNPFGNSTPNPPPFYFLQPLSLPLRERGKGWGWRYKRYPSAYSPVEGVKGQGKAKGKKMLGTEQSFTLLRRENFLGKSFVKPFFFNKMTKYCLLSTFNKLSLATKKDVSKAEFNSNKVEQANKQKQTCLQFQALSLLFVRQAEYVKKNQLLAQISNLGEEGNQPIKNRQTIFAELSGKVFETQGGVTNKKFIKNINKLNKNAETFVVKDQLVNTLKRRASNSIHPEKSVRLGFFHILATQIAATFNFNKFQAPNERNPAASFPPAEINSRQLAKSSLKNPPQGGKPTDTLGSASGEAKHKNYGSKKSKGKPPHTLVMNNALRSPVYPLRGYETLDLKSPTEKPFYPYNYGQEIGSFDSGSRKLAGFKSSPFWLRGGLQISQRALTLRVKKTEKAKLSYFMKESRPPNEARELQSKRWTNSSNRPTPIKVPKVRSNIVKNYTSPPLYYQSTLENHTLKTEKLVSSDIPFGKHSSPNVKRSGTTEFKDQTQSCSNPYIAQFFSSTHNKNLLVSLLKRQIYKGKKFKIPNSSLSYSGLYYGEKRKTLMPLPYGQAKQPESKNVGNLSDQRSWYPSPSAAPEDTSYAGQKKGVALNLPEFDFQKQQKIDSLFLRTIAQEGDLVDLNYKNASLKNF